MAYTIRIQGRGEEMIYTDAEVRLEMERTVSFGHRLYCEAINAIECSPNIPSGAFKGERLEQRVTAQLADIGSRPGLVRSFFRHPSVAYIADC